MKNKIIVSFAVAALITPTLAAPAHALSCLPTDMYLKDVVGKDDVTIFIGTVQDQISADDYTAEVISVEGVKQGYTESELFVYHEKSADWGYFCNKGPGKKGDKGIYLTMPDTFGKHMVTQRLDLSDPLAQTLVDDLSEAEVEGTLGEITSEDKMSQIMTTITDTFKQMQILFKEYFYWKNN